MADDDSNSDAGTSGFVDVLRRLGLPPMPSMTQPSAQPGAPPDVQQGASKAAQWLTQLGLAKPDQGTPPQGLGQAGAPPPGAMSPNMMGPPQQMQQPQGLGQQGAPPPQGPPGANGVPFTPQQAQQMQQVPGYGAVQGGLDKGAPGGPSINMKGLAGPQPSGAPPKGPLDKAAGGPPPPKPPSPVTGQQAAAISRQFRIPPDKAVQLLDTLQNHKYENDIKQYNAFLRQEGIENARQKAAKAKTPQEAAHWVHMANAWMRMGDKLAGAPEVPTGERTPTYLGGLIGGNDVTEPARAKYDRKAQEAMDKSEKVMSGDTEEEPSESGAETPEVPAVGAVMKGYKFKGGDPSDQKNWEKAGG